MMKKVRILFLLLSVMLVGLTGACSMFPSEQPVNISLAVLQLKMQKAMDPDNLFRDSKSYVQKQMLMVKKDWEDEKSYIVEVKYKRPDKLKMTTWEENQPTNSIIFNGKNAWIVNYKDKQRTLIKGEQLEKMKVLFYLGKPGSKYEDIFKEVKIFEAELDGRPYYKLICMSKFNDQPPLIIYVGKNNFLTKRIAIPPKIESTIDKYGLYDGVIIPEESTEIVGGSKKRYKLIAYKLNVKLKDSEFFPPVF